MLPGFSTRGMTVSLILLARPAVSAVRLTPLSSPLSLCPSVLPSVSLRAVVGLPGPCVTSDPTIICLAKLPALSSLSLKCQHGFHSLIQPWLMQWVLHLHSIIEETETETTSQIQGVRAKPRSSDPNARHTHRPAHLKSNTIESRTRTIRYSHFPIISGGQVDWFRGVA